MKYSPYSYSKISLYQQCPKKFKFRYIDKVDVPFIQSEALIKGSTLHDILEKHPQKSSYKNAEKYQAIADIYINSDRGSLLMSLPSKREVKIGLTKDLTVGEYSDKNIMFKGIVDYYTYYEDYLWLVDYKSGKYKDLKWQSFDQNMFYAIYFFEMYQKIDKIKITYDYIETDSDNSILLERMYIDNYKKELLQNIINIESDNNFNACTSKLCEYCEYSHLCKEFQEL